MNPYTSPNKSPIVPYQYRYKGKEQELFKVITAHRRKKSYIFASNKFKVLLIEDTAFIQQYSSGTGQVKWKILLF